MTVIQSNQLQQEESHDTRMMPGLEPAVEPRAAQSGLLPVLEIRFSWSVGAFISLHIVWPFAEELAEP